MAVAIAGLLPPLVAWFTRVNHAVEGPYLDEAFHVRQAQHYCSGHFHIWDPKITTPPGLYLLSYAVSPAIGCSITALRLVNAASLVALLVVLRATYGVRRGWNREDGFLSGIVATHSAVNIVLFPPLFFFSALYYTDVPSTLSVMVFYWYFLRQIGKKAATVRQGAIQVLLGIISLWFRQTNIFWVAIMPAALTLVVCLDQGHRVVRASMYKRAEGFGDTTWSVAKTSLKMNVVYDPPVRDAFFEDYIRALVSVAAGTLKAFTEPNRVLEICRALTPYGVILGLFTSFVLWNGSVVLGDKSNHIATIHAAQMLYLWPFIAFFSWPLLLGHFALLPLSIISRFSSLAGFEPFLHFRRRSFLPRPRLFVIFTAIAAIVVRFNTIVHPFTLADNRHFNFYIFKRLLKPWWIRFLVAPVYVLTGWACLDSRGAQPAAAPDHIPAGEVRDGAKPRDEAADTLRANSQSDALTRSVHLPDGTSTPMVSFILIFLATSALSLCTAPLVEPRYCIIPYIIWRLHLPLQSVDPYVDKRLATSRSIRDIASVYDWRVVGETLWALLVNAVTGYIFLHWTFTWPSEPLRVQRFMW